MDAARVSETEPGRPLTQVSSTQSYKVHPCFPTYHLLSPGIPVVYLVGQKTRKDAGSCRTGLKTAALTSKLR